MIVRCPQCKTLGRYKGKETEKIHCKRCNSSFPARHNSFPDDTSARVWRIKGVNASPVSLRVIKYRISTGHLGQESEISCDGEKWIKVSHHPVFFYFREKSKVPDPAIIPAKPAILPEQHNEENEVPESSKRGLRATMGIPFLAFAFAAIAYFPVMKTLEYLDDSSEKIRMENAALKENLGKTEDKVEELEKRLVFITQEVEGVKNSEEEFRRTKRILEDIKKTIDSPDIYLVISLAEDKLYVKIGAKTLKEYVVSTGKGRTVMKSTGETYNFLTPRGKMIIRAKERNPVWIKPNWVWLENGKELPENLTIEERTVKGQLGRYRLKLEGNYSIHGTSSGNVKGGKETHGCIRLGREDLKELYTMVKRDTEVYIY